MHALNLLKKNYNERKHFIWLTLSFVFLFLFFCIKSYSMNTQFYDESIYLYQAKLLAQGLIPYKDFTLAHPPMPLLIHAFFLKLFGNSFPFGLVSLLFTLFSTFIMSIIVRKRINHATSFFFMVIFLYNSLIFSISTSIVGVCVSLFFLSLAIFFYDKKNIKLAALFIALTLFSRLHTLPIILGLFTYSFFINKNECLELLKTCAKYCLIFFIVLILFCDFDNVYKNLILYHWNKQHQPQLSNRIWDAFLNQNAIYLILFGLSQVMLLLKPQNILKLFKHTLPKEHFYEKTIPLLILCSFLVLSNLIFLLIFQHFFMYYAYFLLFFAAIPSSYFITSSCSNCFNWAKKIISQKKLNVSSLPKFKIITYIFSITFLTFNIGSTPLFPQLTETNKAYARPWVYHWHTNDYLPNFIDKTIKILFWEKEKKYPHGYSLFTTSLWESSMDQDRTARVKKIAKLIEKNTSPGDTIFGDGASTPMLSMLSKRNITMNIVETNIQQVMTNALNLDEVLPQLIKNKNKIIITRIKGRGWYGIASDHRLQKFIKDNYEKVHAQFVDRGFNHMIVYKLKDQSRQAKIKELMKRYKRAFINNLQREHAANQSRLQYMLRK